MPENLNASFKLVKDVEYGTLELQDNGSFSFNANEFSFLSKDEIMDVNFTYEINSHNKNITQNVNIKIIGVNNPPKANPDSSFVDLSKMKNKFANIIIKGNIISLENSYKSVEQWIFEFDGGGLDIDTLSELSNANNSFIDLNQNGIQEGVDIYIYLFKKENNSWVYVARNDDSKVGIHDGSTHNYDSYLNLNLQKGTYLLAIGGYSLSLQDALNGFQNNSYKGPYQVTFNKKIKFLSLAKNATQVTNKNNYIYDVLKNDTDIDKKDKLKITKAYIVDQFLNTIYVQGEVLIIDNKIVYFPKESFNNLQNQSEEVNIVYEITDNINFDKSLLSLQVINSTLTHVDIKVNEEILRLLKDTKN